MAEERKNLITVAPGVYVDPLARADLAEIGPAVLCDERGLAQIGLAPDQMRTLRRLHYCGCVRLVRFAPRRWLLDLRSWNDHLSRAEKEPEMWEDERMRRRWRIAVMTV